MSYRPGQVGLAEGLALVFILTVVRIFLTSLVFVVEQAAQFGPIAIILAGFYTIAAFFLLLFVTERVPGDLVAICRQVLGRPAAWLVTLFFILWFWANGALLLRQVAENTLITSLPEMKLELIIAWYALVIGILLFMGFGAIVRASYLFTPYLLIALFLVLLLLLPYYNVYRLAPWQGAGLAAGLKASVAFTSFNAYIIALIVMAPAFQSQRTIRAAAFYGLGISVTVKAVYIAAYIMVFGTVVGSEKTIPFFEMARLVYLSRYLQHIESLFIVLWVVIDTLAIAASLYLAMYLLTRLLGLPTDKPLLPLATVTTVGVAMLPESFADAVVLDTLFNRVSSIAIYVFPVLLFLATLYKSRRKT